MELKSAIRKVFPNAPVDAIMNTIKKFGIKNPVDFVAQIAHESGNFRTYVENLNYSAEGLARVWPNRFANADKTPNEKAKSIARNPREIANAVYNCRMGNRPNTDDGWNYRGRGAIQITGRNNYRSIAGILYDVGLAETREFYFNNPDGFSKIPAAIYSAGAFWKLNNLSNVTDFNTLTKRINGGLTGIEDRRKKKEALENAINNGKS